MPKNKEKYVYLSPVILSKLIQKSECMECTIGGHKRKLLIHHINYNHYDNRLENMIVLCYPCHSNLHHNDKRTSSRKIMMMNNFKKKSKEYAAFVKEFNKSPIKADAKAKVV